MKNLFTARNYLFGRQYVLIVILGLLACLITPVPTLAEFGAMPGMDDTVTPGTVKKRRPRVSLGPATAKRPGGMGGEVFKEHIDAIEVFFRPLSGNVVSSTGGYLVSDLSDSGIIPRMRFHVMRATAAFTHPVTGERVTGTETPVGMAEVVEAKAGQRPRLRLIDGVAAKGDMIRIFSAPVTVLFYQGADVDWDVSEEYYYWLEGSERYIVIDAASGDMRQADLLKAANEANASVVITISSEAMPEGKGPGVALRQRAIWASDGKELYTSVVVVDEEMLGRFKIAGEMFSPSRSKPVLELKAPFRAELLEAADLDCDGVDEMVLSTGSRMSVFALDIKLRYPFGHAEPFEIEGESDRKHVWLEAADLDGDGCDEILLSTVKDDHEAHSYVYDFTEGKLKAIWEGDVFARVLDGVIHVQDSDPDGGYRGEIRKLGPVSGGWKEGSGGDSLTLPEGVNIYDFAFLDAGKGKRNVLAYDSSGRLALYNGSSGPAFWHSRESYGGAVRLFNRKSALELAGEKSTEQWRVNDRMLSTGPHVFSIFRELASPTVRGLGFKSSRIMGIAMSGAGVQENSLIRDIPDAARCMSISGERLYVLRDTYSVNLMNLFRGRKLFVSKIMVYSLEGM